MNTSMKTRIAAAITALAMMTAGTAALAEAKTVSPVPNVNMEDSLDTCTLHVGFSLSDVSDKDLIACVYDTFNYDIADISQLQKGDTIETASGDVTVEDITDTDGTLTINGTETLTPVDEDNTYYQTENGEKVYVIKGQAQLTFSDYVTVNYESAVADGSLNAYWSQSVTVPAADVAAVLEEVSSDLGTDFQPAQTTVEVEDGYVVVINISVEG